MAVKQILVGKAGSSATPLTLIKGDSNTQIIEMIVERYYGGVDLTPLAWSVTVENANGASDEYRGIEAIANGTNIAVRWKTTGTATAAVGLTKFKLSGYTQDEGNVLIWQSGDYFIRINDTFEHVPGAETQAELTGVQKLIIYVDGELNKVIKAGNDAAEAARAANAAADRANSVADGKNEGRITALEQFTTKPGEPYAVTGKLVQLDNFEGMPMNAVTRIEPVQAGSGEPSPSNIRPISGHTGAKLTKCGKNLAEQIVYGYVTLEGNNVYVRIDNNSTSVIAGVVEGNEYTISCNATLDRFGIGKLEAANPTNGALLTRYRYYGNQSSAHELHFTAEFTGTAFIYLKSTKDETAKDSLQVEIGSVATEYTPYQGETFTANFGQNVYGGTLDWGKGVLTVDRAMVTLTGTENVQFSSSGAGRFVYYGLQNVIKPFSNSAIVASIVCSHYKPSTAEYLYNTPDAYAIAQNNGTEIWFSDTGFDSPSAFKAYLSAQNAAGTPVQVCYKLANPTTIQLTPAQLTALQGMNNIFCDAGETTVSGRKDILWLTSGLIEQIDTLKKAIISLGGNV